MNLFSDGTIHFIDGSTEHIKYALVGEIAVMVTADSGTYKICNARSVSNDYIHAPFKVTSFTYSIFKWNDELHEWIAYTNLDYVECRE